MAAKRSQDGSISVCQIDNPPINALSQRVRRALVEAVNRAAADPNVVALVLIGNRGTFCAGADINELGTPAAIAEPDLPTVIGVIENCPKPVVAAIEGICMGGGLELALGCHYRVVTTQARIAMPEVKLGLIPGAGGTQRLPRLIGLRAALNLIVSGATISSEELAGSGLFDCVTNDILLNAALRFAARIAASEGPWPRARDRQVDSEGQQSDLVCLRASIFEASDRSLAALKGIDLTVASVNVDFNTALKLERQVFFELLRTPRSRALIHAFLGERKAARISDVLPSTPTRPVRSVAVIGAGTMGSGIAAVTANAGLPVTIVEERSDVLTRALANIRKTWESAVRKGRFTAAGLEERFALLQTTTDPGAIAEADLVIEAVFEDMTVKQSVFEMMDRIAKPGAILASNTSTLDLNRLASFTRRPQDVVGLHFFSPVHAMRLLEVVRGQQTAKDVLATAMKFAKTMRKVAVVAGVCDGFIGNRMIDQYLRQAEFLLDEGALPSQVDTALEKFGMAMGPFRMSDLAGNDIGWRIRNRRKMERPNYVYSTLLDKLCEKNRFGQKNGAGWYTYRNGTRVGCCDNEVDELVIGHSASIGLARRYISDDEITERCIFALVNEGARLLSEGVAQSASDIDVVYVNGYGFPRHRGGPMLYADTVGLENLLQRFESFAANPHGDPSFWEPAPLLLRLANTGTTFC